jgi:hypothetical protein
MMIQSKIKILVPAIFIFWQSFSGYSQDIYPVTVEKDRIIYQIGTPGEFVRILPVALPEYVVLIRPIFDLFPGMSDPEIKAELIAALNNFKSKGATARQKTFFLQNLAHLVLMDIDNVEKWKKDYGEGLKSLCADQKFTDRAIRVQQLINDYIRYYLPAIQMKKDHIEY